MANLNFYHHSEMEGVKNAPDGPGMNGEICFEDVVQGLL